MGEEGTGWGGGSLPLDIHAREAGFYLGLVRTLDGQREWMKGLVRVLEKVGWRQGGGTEAQRNSGYQAWGHRGGVGEEVGDSGVRYK